MKNVVVLNAKSTKHLFQCLQSQFGIEELPPGAYFLREKDNNILYVTRDIGQIEYDLLRINSIGIYIGEYNTDKTQVRLSIEGSQLIGKIAKKGILELSAFQFREYLRGKEFEVNNTQTGYLIIKHNADFGGCARIKEGILLNFTPKARRINSED